jgi:hypothetical protein
LEASFLNLKKPKKKESAVVRLLCLQNKRQVRRICAYPKFQLSNLAA